MSSFSDDWRSLKRSLKGSESEEKGKDSNNSTPFRPSIRSRSRLSSLSGVSGGSRRSLLLLGSQHSPLSSLQGPPVQADHLDRLAAATQLPVNVLRNLARDHASTSAHEGSEASTEPSTTTFHPLHPRARPPQSLDATDCASSIPNPLGAHPVGNPITFVQPPITRPSGGVFRELIFDQDAAATQDEPNSAVTEDTSPSLSQTPESPQHLPVNVTTSAAPWPPLETGSSCYSLRYSVSSDGESARENKPSSPKTASGFLAAIGNHPSSSSSSSPAVSGSSPSAVQHASMMPRSTPTTALLIIDMQNFFAGMSSSISTQILKLAGHFASNSRHIIVTQHGHSAEELSPPSGNQLVRKWGAAGSIAVGSHDWEFQPSIDALIAQEKLPVVAKNTYDAFLGTPLEEILRGKGVERVVVCGVMTDCCVDTTARSAFNRGFETWVVADASASASSEQHETGLKAFGFAFGEVMETEEVVRRI